MMHCCTSGLGYIADCPFASKDIFPRAINSKSDYILVSLIYTTKWWLKYRGWYESLESRFITFAFHTIQYAPYDTVCIVWGL